ncbi:Imm63 family immunity protein [Mycobacterium sp.]|uniref:Imm63 family immunity protein n=1 Tax=Mycobacterium sp. TaxID=1785 RepID=UPI003D6ABB90
MVDDKTAHLQSEINRLAAKLNAQPVEVGHLLKNDDLNIFIDDDGRYHYSYWERGKPNFDRVGEIDDVLYWFAEGLTFDAGSSYSARHSRQTQDFRILLWARQYELLNQLSPRWAKRCVRETANKLRGWGKDEDIELLPNIPERNS